MSCVRAWKPNCRHSGKPRVPVARVRVRVRRQGQCQGQGQGQPRARVRARARLMQWLGLAGQAPRARLGPVGDRRRVARTLVESPCGAHEDHVEHEERKGPQQELAC